MKRIYLSMIAAFISAIAFAQDADKKIDVNVNTNSGSGGWYTSPMVWIIGAAVFILLLVALTRGRRSD